MQDAASALRGALLGELEHRREKQWKIFSWMAGLFVAMIGGTLALKLSNPPSDFSALLKIAITIAALGLQGYAMLWIRQNWRLELKVLRKLHECGIDFPTNDKEEQFLGERENGRFVFGYVEALLLVFFALVIVVWVKPA